MGNGEVKLSLFAYYMIIQVENPNESTKQLLNQINLGKLQDKVKIKAGISVYQ